MNERLGHWAAFLALLLVSPATGDERAAAPGIAWVSTGSAARSERLVLRGAGFGNRGDGFLLVDERRAIVTTWRGTRSTPTSPRPPRSVRCP
jgi:hypothetical protein